MDLSSEYIKMCAKVEEIQRVKYPHPIYLHKSGMGQVCHSLNGDFDWGQPTDSIIEPFVVPMPIAIWLPRQDQLQEMINLPLSEKIQSFCRWNEATGFIWYSDGKFTSMEQLWLAFVMLTLYHKKWYNGEWRVENDRDTKNSQDAPFRGEIHQSNMP